MIVQNDITKMKVDAIVNAANESLLGGGGVDGCIHRAAGPGLLAECRQLGGCRTGSAKITGAYRLTSRYVIHTVGPIWRDGRHGEREQLSACYRSSLELAAAHGCASAAFPLISAGVYGYPPAQALEVAVGTIGAFLQESEMTVYIVIYDRSAYRIGETTFAEIRRRLAGGTAACREDSLGPANTCRRAEEETTAGLLFTAEKMAAPAPELADALDRLDESFSEMLLRKIDEKGLTDAACYKKANIDRKLFSKIRSDRHYRPSKPTALAFAVALELPLAETEDLLRKAGYALSPSSKADIIVGYFLERGCYNVFEINEALFAFDQSLLGS